MSAQRERWVLGIGLILLALISAVLANESWRIHSHHGLLHSSIVYSIFDRGLPPENPLMAGVPLGYPYGHHAVLAFVMRALPIAPPWLFAATNWLALGLTLLILDRTAQRLGGGAAYRALVVLLAMFGTSPIARGPLSEFVASFGADEGRAIPLLKFATVNSNPLGVLCFALALYALVRALVAGRVDARAACLLGLAWAGNGLLYPTTWPAVVICTAVAALVMLRHSTPPRGDIIWRIGIPCLAASAVVIPWLLFVAGDKASSSLPQLDITAAHLLRNAAIAMGAVVIPIALLIWKRQRTGSASHATQLTLALCTGALGGAFALLHLPLHTEYKFLLLSQIPLAFLVAGAMERLLAERLWVVVMLLAVLFLPGGSWIATKITHPLAARDPATTAGRSIEHSDPAQRELHHWLIGNTPADAVLVDTHLSLPALARRSLYVGTDERRSLEPMPRSTDGVGLTAQRWVVHVHGVELRAYERRSRIVRALLWKQGSDKTDEIGAAIAADLPGRPVYAIAREAAARERLANSTAFNLAFENSAAGIYRLDAGR